MDAKPPPCTTCRHFREDDSDYSYGTCMRNVRREERYVVVTGKTWHTDVGHLNCSDERRTGSCGYAGRYHEPGTYRDQRLPQSRTARLLRWLDKRGFPFP